MKIPAYLIHFDDGNLVEYRTLEFLSANEKEIETGYQIYDRTLHHIARADTEEMAQLICDSINLAYKTQIIKEEQRISLEVPGGEQRMKLPLAVCFLLLPVTLLVVLYLSATAKN